MPLTEIVVCKGQVKSHSYTGPVKIVITSPTHILDMEVRHYQCHAPTYEDETFAASVIDLLILHGKLDPDKKYSLVRAELGMQEDGKTVYEDIIAYEEAVSDGRSIGDELVTKWGAELDTD